MHLKNIQSYYTLMKSLMIISAIGASLIGISSATLLLTLGKVTGISGILRNAFSLNAINWQHFFIIGMLLGGTLISYVFPERIGDDVAINVPMIVSAYLVGRGARLGSGCTSGHMLCGVSRLSSRSLVATSIFFSIAVLVQFFNNVSPLKVSNLPEEQSNLVHVIVVTLTILTLLPLMLKHQFLLIFWCGFTFAVGLSFSGMIQSSVVLGFLGFLARPALFDPSLFMIILFALLPNMILYYFYVQKLERPFLASAFDLPKRSDVDFSLILGAVLFGIGWGIGGTCPGPALVQLASLRPGSIMFVLFMIIGLTLDI